MFAAAGKYGAFIRMSLVMFVLLVGLLFSAVAYPQDAGNKSINEEEITFWVTVKDSQNPAELEAYLTAFPNGLFAPIANLRLRKLGAQNNSSSAVKQAQESDTAPIPLKETGFIGVISQDEVISGEPVGARITDIFEFGPARKSDLRIGDVVEEIDGRTIRSAVQFLEIVRGKRPGETAKLRVNRDGRSNLIRVPVDETLASIWQAAQDGDANAMLVLGYAYYRGSTITRDYEKSRYWLERAGEAGNAAAYFRLGIFYEKGVGVAKNDKTAFSHYLKSAQMGYENGQFWTGYLYGKGRGVAKSDEKAFEWYLKAAKQGHSSAMQNLGIRNQAGRGVTKNMEQAALWYERAIEAGNLASYSGLGYMYKFGKGGRPKDLAKAIRLFRSAADKGDASGQYNLGLMYEKGIGVLKDRNEALRLYRLAAVDDKRAAKKLKDLNEPLYSVAEIQRLLKQLGHNPGKSDGKMGRKTREAIRNYQNEAGLSSTGEPSVDLVENLQKTVLKQSSSTGEPITETNSSSSAISNFSTEDLSDLNSLD